MEINKYKKYEKIRNKDASFFQTIRSINKFLGEKRLLFFLSLFIIILAEIAIIIVPFFIKSITENIDNIDYVIDKCKILLVLYSINFIFTFVGCILIDYISERLTLRLRKSIYDKIIDMPFSELIETEIGKINSLILYDTDTISQSLSKNIINMITNFVSIVGALICSLIISSLLSVFLLIPLLLSFIRTFYISKIMRKKYYLKSIELSNYENQLLEWINGKTVIDSYNLGNIYDKALEDEGNNYFDVALSAEKYGSSISPFSHLIQHVCIVLISIMALVFVNLGLTTIAIYSAFILYSKKFADPVGELSNSFTEFSNSYSSFRRINEFINKEYIINDGNIEIEKIDKIEASNLSFSYNNEKLVLDNIDFSSIPSGMVAIVGHTGCGKTTLISLFLKLFDNYNGDIKANDIDYNNLKSMSFYNKISYVSQDAWIFNGTVLENLTYGLEEYNLDEVINTCKILGIDSFINKLPNGYEEIIDNKSDKLSNGQLQMISIARAMIQNMDFLIMDEPTSNIDVFSEISIKNAIERIRKNKSTIIIAHRLSTINKADCIYVMDNGKVIEKGTHEELLKNKNLYYKMFSTHFITE